MAADLQEGRWGLDEREAAQRLVAEGPNELPSQRRRSDLRVLIDVIREPMLALLLAGASIYALIGAPEDAAALAVAAALVITLTFVQAHRAEHSLHALRELTSPRALVERDGHRRRIDSREVVRGDRLILQEGDRIAADAVVREAEALQVDESLLTGESLPVAKQVVARGALDGAAERDCRVHAGSLVVAGRAAVEVVATGDRTELGRIGVALRDIEDPVGSLQLEIRAAVRWFGLIGFLLCATLVLVYALIRGDVMTGLLAGVALGMAVIPEEFPVVSTVLFAFSGHRLARRGVLTRQMPAIDTLGSVTVLCVDKTGTLTENRMQVEAWVTRHGDVQPGDAGDTIDGAELLGCALRASEALGADPIDRAVFELATARAVRSADQVHTVADVPILTHMARGRWFLSAQGTARAYVKGAPEALVAAAEGDVQAQAYWLAAAAKHASAGRRVLAVGRSPILDARTANAAAILPTGLEILGLLVLVDPVRAGVPAALAECREAGIRVVLITGDHVDTARRIAQTAGLAVDGVLRGDELDGLDDAALDRLLPRVSICARARPEHKLRLVQRLQASGAVVGMTGDGVNDATALRAAHVGIALGGRGTDVAREASDLVLTDDRFETIVTGIREGRRVWINLRLAVTYIAAVHVPTAGMAVLAALAGWPLLLLPIHIASLELLIDPACTLVFEAEEPPDDMMKVPPRSGRLFDRRLILAGLYQGTLVLATVLLLVLAGRSAGFNEAQLRSLAFVAIVLANASLLFANQSTRGTLRARLAHPNRWLWGIATAGTVFAVAITQFAPLAELFHVAPLPLEVWGALVVITLGLAFVMRTVRVFRVR